MQELSITESGETNNLNVRGEKGQWKNVTQESPCPICGKGGWCSVSLDNQTIHCRRVSEGAARTGRTHQTPPELLTHA